MVVLIGEDIGATNLARLRQAHPDLDFRLCLDEASFIETAAEAQIIFTKQIPAAALSAASHLRWVQAGTAGVERWLNLLGERDVILTNARGAHGTPMAELILGQMLAFATGLHTLLRARPGDPEPKKRALQEKFELAGQTLCVVGLGDIGGSLAEKAKGLGMRVVGVRRSQAPFPGLDQQVTPDRLLDVLPEADHVALCLPLTSETRSIVGEQELRVMKPSAYIYNVGRGASISAAPLLRALQEGWIAGAGLDVTDPEPLPVESPLWTLPNVILSQHTSGSSPFNADRITAIFLDNLERYRRGEPLQNVVNRQLQY